MLPRLSDLAYRALYGPVGTAAVLLWSFRVAGRHHIPPTGPVLLIGNHQSFLDIPLMGLANPRRTRFLARRTLKNNRLLGGIIDWFGNITVDQEGFSRAGLEGILGQLREGHVVLIYPEGERTRTGRLGPLKPGVSLLVRKAACPVVPIAIAGAFTALPRWRVVPRIAPPFLGPSPAQIAVAIGPPLDGAQLARLEREEVLDKLTRALRQTVEQAERLRAGGRFALS